MKQEIKRTIDEVLNLENGEYIKSNSFFNNDLNELTKYRSELQKAIQGYREPLFVCPFCKQKIRIRGGKIGKNNRKSSVFHFAHLKDSAVCEIKTNHKFTKEEINRIKYNGSKESLLHQSLKNKIAENLIKNQETKKEFSDINIEKIIKGKTEKEWKKPDISASFKNIKIAIELQLSTTWLDVITKRQEFYKTEGIFILWIFNKFDINDDTRKLTFNDVIYTNNQNAYVFNDELNDKSIETKDLVINCFYKNYYIKNHEIHEEWKSSLITISDLTFDNKHKRLYYHDSEKQEIALKQEIKKNIYTKNQKKLFLEKQQQRIRLLKREINNCIEKTEIENIKLKENLQYLGSLGEEINIITENIFEINPFKTVAIWKKNIFIKLNSDFEKKIKELDPKMKNMYACLKETIKESQILNSLETKTIGEKEYTILDNTKYNSLISNNYNKISIIHKTQINDLFNFSTIRKLEFYNDFIKIQFSKVYYFLMEKKKLEEIIKINLENCQTKIDQQNTILSQIKMEAKSKIEAYLKDNNLKLKKNIKKIQIEKEKLIVELNKINLETKLKK